MMLLNKALGHILSCKNASHLVSRKLDRDLGPLARWALRLHLLACDACARFEQQMRFLRESMRKYRE